MLARHRPRLILNLPVLSDEAALQFSELLKSLAKHFDDCCHQQIRRAQRDRRKQRLALERSLYEPQHRLGEEFDEPFQFRAAPYRS
jgi:hypothetical protein